VENSKKLDNKIDLDALSRGDEAMVKEVYRLHRGAFIQWSKSKFNCSEEDAADSFQDAIIVMIKMAREGKMSDIKVGLKTYLFAIGKRLVWNRFRSQSKTDTVDPESFKLTADLDTSILDKIEEDHRQNRVRLALQKLSEKCQQLLTLLFFKQYSTEAVVAELGYKGADVVWVQKSRCMKALREHLT